ncbi:RING finger protein 214 [Thalassophryne amazonica]|uniref:RING finger protein 214 n=1 Tax=Thalassophryne amazonica TaxID=390379 RepID=UPI00147093B9|nr:RING finger protein 214 [Thalassophryne amazonica]
MASGDQLHQVHNPHQEPDEDPGFQLQLENLTLEELMHRVQSVQTDSWTAESSTNTEPDWEAQVAAMLEYSTGLEERYEKLRKQQDEQETERQQLKQELQKKKDEATRQHQVLMEKLQSLRVKLQLNNSKATRKTFLSKRQELISEKSRIEEDNVRLGKELEESEKKLTLLIDEQSEEQRQWQEELEELRQEMERVRKEAQEAELVALQDEVAAVEKQRAVAMARIEAWLQELGLFLNTLRTEFPQRYQNERLKWEKKQDLVRKNQAELQSHFQEMLQQLQQGHTFESLSRISMPVLPQLPMADLRITQIVQSVAPPQFQPPPINWPIAPQRHPHHFHYQPPPPRPPQYRQRYHQPPPQHHFQPPLQFKPHFRPPVRAIPPYSVNVPTPIQAMYPVAPSPPLPPTPAASDPASAGKLDKLLEKLGARFPQCNRAQLTSLLQQVKTSRGTLAGMSMEEVVEQVGFKLAQNERSAPAPVSRAAPLGPIQRPMPLPHRASAAAGQSQLAGPRKLCLMCQNHVDPESRHPLTCSHTIHKDCIRVWLQSSKNNSCPFCPMK